MPENISLFIPSYNIDSYLVKNIPACFESLAKSYSGFEIIIVDDNSSDGTSQSVNGMSRDIAASSGRIKYMYFANGPSRRENLAKAFNSAEYDTVAFMDGDFSCDISYLIEAHGILEMKDLDIVIGSRYIKGAKVRRKIVRRILSFFYNRTVRLLFGSKVMDHQCGLKVFKKNTVMRVIGDMGYDDRFQRGWFWDAELLIRVQKNGLKLHEMPVKWDYSDVSSFNLIRELRSLAAIIRLKINYILKK